MLFCEIIKARKLARAALAGLVLATGVAAATTAMQTPALARGGGGGGGGEGGGGGGEGVAPGLFFRVEAALQRALQHAAAERRRGRRPPTVRVVRPVQDHDCDIVRFRATRNGPLYACEMLKSARN